MQYLKETKKILLLISLSIWLTACGGGGGDEDIVPVDISTRYSIPTDLTKITYPDSYTIQTTSQSDLNTNPCNLNLDVVTVPKSWLGNFPLPDINGAPLSPGTMRGMAIKDIMLHDNPAFILGGTSGVPNNGCTGDLQLELGKTIEKLADLNVDYVYLPQWHWASKRPNGTWYFVKAEDTFGPVSDVDLTYFVQTAHAQGMKVIMLNQIQGVRDTQDSPVYTPSPTMDNFNKWFAAYQDFMIERSTFFESIGIDVWEIGCHYCMYAGWMLNTTQEIDLFAQEYEQAVSNIRVNYSGKLYMQALDWLNTKPNLMNNVDILGVGIFHQPLTTTQAVNLSVDSYKTAIINAGWEGFITTWNSVGKQLMFTAAMQSRANAFTLPGYMEEAVCTSTIGDLNVSQTTCIQRETQPDFSLQAIAIEAYMELINAQTLSHDPIVLMGDYWATDPLAPHTAFPNLGTSPRNKPAEGIILEWFAR